MADKSGIEWTDATWNPVTGCDRVSPGCAHCYALDLAGRLKKMGSPGYQNDGNPKTSGPGFAVTLHPERIDQPIRWTKPRMVFVNSMSDLFHESVPDEFIGQVLNTIYFAQHHTFQVLTKRPERMRDCLKRYYSPDGLDGTGNPSVNPSSGYPAEVDGGRRVLHNLWLGVSIENRRFVDRADILRDTPAAVRFISAEPLLGPLVPDRFGFAGTGNPVPTWNDGFDGPGLNLTDIDWLIVGGESGPKHRPIEADWVRDLAKASSDWGTAFFFKQWGGSRPKENGRELDGRTWDEMPVSN